MLQFPVHNLKHFIYDYLRIQPLEATFLLRLSYINNVVKMLKANGVLVITSCNWTEPELEAHFENLFDKVLAFHSPYKLHYFSLK